MNYKDIAVIGMSMRLPQAKNADELHRNLSEKRDCIRKVPQSRMELLKLDPDTNYLEVGYIDDIEYFDHRFFNISSMEADVMCIEQRMSLEMAAEAILDAGYSLESFRGKNCCVYYSSSENEYKLLCGQESAAAYTGNLKSLTAGKICYYLDLRGPNVTVDSACSSSLVGMHEACMKIVSGECELALIGGLTVNIYIPCFDDKDFNNLGVISGGGRSYSFDARAQGTGMGEGGGFVLLKSLDAARRDHDHIYGIVRGSAINCDGSRGSSLTAPSVAGQQDAILEAWRRGNVSGSDITEFEAHGTGTLIGDPIEAESIENSLKTSADGGEKVWLSAMKSSTGHLAASAGIAAVLKCAVQFDKGVTYPLANFETPNPYIDFEHMRLQPLQEVHHWEKGKRRIVGINSFGFSGTNAHVVMENDREEHILGEKGEMVLKLSAKDENSLKEMAAQTAAFIRRHSDNIGNIVYTMDTGRDDYVYRSCVSGNSAEEIASSLEKAAVKQTDERKTALVLMQPEGLTAEMLAEKTEALRRLLKAGFSYDYLIADDFGKFVASQAQNDSGADFAETAEKFASAYADKSAAAVNKLTELSGSEKLTAVFMGEIPAGMPENDACIALGYVSESAESFICEYYVAGGNVKWDMLFDANEYYKTSAPTYVFSKVKHWIYPKHKFSMLGIVDNIEEEEAQQKEATGSIEEFREKMLALWTEVLEEEITAQDDFFDCGGNSLTGMMMIEEVKNRWGIEVDFDDVYDHATVEEFCEYLMEIAAESQPSAANEASEEAEKVEIQGIPEDAPFETNQTQRMIFDGIKEYPNNSGWNLCMAIGMEGDVDISRLEKALDMLIRTNDSLRTVISDDGLTQRVLPHTDYKLPVIEAEGESDEERLAYCRELVNKAANVTVPIKDKPAVDFRLLRVTDKYSILYLALNHINSDGSSLGVMLGQINHYYRGGELIKMPHDFRENSLYQAAFPTSGKGLQQRAFWERYLKGIDFTPRYFPDGDTGVTTEKAVGKNLVFPIIEELAQKIRTVSRQFKVTPYIFTLYAFQVMVAKLIQRDDLFSLSVVANRREPAYQQIMGCLAKLVIVRTKLDRGAKLGDEMHRLNEDIRNIQDNQEYHLTPLLEEIRGEAPRSMNDWGEFFMAFQNYKSEELSFEDLKLSLEPISKNGCMTKLQLAVSENARGMYGIFQYNESVITDATALKVRDLYVALLERMAEKPDMTVEELLAD